MIIVSCRYRPADNISVLPTGKQMSFDCERQNESNIFLGTGICSIKHNDLVLCLVLCITLERHFKWKFLALGVVFDESSNWFSFIRMIIEKHSYCGMIYWPVPTRCDVTMTVHRSEVMDMQNVLKSSSS